MADLSKAQMRRIEPYVLLPNGIGRVDDRRHRLRYPERIALARCAARAWSAQDDRQPFVRRSRLGISNKVLAELERKAGKLSRLTIDAAHPKALRAVASLLRKGLFPDMSGAPRAARTPGRTPCATVGNHRSSCCSAKAR